MTENTEIANVPTAAVEQKKVKKASAGIKKPAVKPNHPPTAQMVDSAIKTLKERGGSSLLAVKKYLAANYKVDADKLAPFIKKYLKSSVESGHLIQTKGKGASGSFKLSAAATKPKKENKPKVEKTAKKSVTKKSAVAGDKKKKTTAAKKTADKKKMEKSATKAIKKSGSVKTKQKSTKPSKTDAKKPKTPKPKKASSPKKVAVKKTAKK